jgi:hypothetical protein
VRSVEVIIANFATKGNKYLQNLQKTVFTLSFYHDLVAEEIAENTYSMNFINNDTFIPEINFIRKDLLVTFGE